MRDVVYQKLAVNFFCLNQRTKQSKEIKGKWHVMIGLLMMPVCPSGTETIQLWKLSTNCECTVHMGQLLCKKY